MQWVIESVRRESRALSKGCLWILVICRSAASVFDSALNYAQYIFQESHLAMTDEPLSKSWKRRDEKQTTAQKRRAHHLQKDKSHFFSHAPLENQSSVEVISIHFIFFKQLQMIYVRLSGDHRIHKPRKFIYTQQINFRLVIIVCECVHAYLNPIDLLGVNHTVWLC